MSYTTLKIEHRGAAAWVWMNRPELHNAFDETLIAELTEAFTALDRDPAVRAIVLAGAGKSFSAGADLNWMQRQGAAPLEANLSDARKLATLFRTISMCTTPTLARVHGAALGGGMGLASACDICIASTKAQFATSEVRLGIIPRRSARTSCARSASAMPIATSRRRSASAASGRARSASRTRSPSPMRWTRRSTRSSTRCWPAGRWRRRPPPS